MTKRKCPKFGIISRGKNKGKCRTQKKTKKKSKSAALAGRKHRRRR
jgi:hypothetical protein